MSLFGAIADHYVAAPTNSLRDEILSHSPLWFAECNEASGTVMVDSGGSGRDGTIDADVVVGQPSILAGAPSGASWQTGTGGGGGVVVADSWMAVPNYTAVVFCYLTSYDTQGNILLARSNVGASNTRALKCWNIQVVNGVVGGRCYSSANGTVSVSSAAGAAPLNTQLMLSLTYDGTNASWRKNGGTIVASAALAGDAPTFAQNAQPISLGRASVISPYSTPGNIQGGAFFDTVLSDADLDAIWSIASTP